MALLNLEASFKSLSVSEKPQLRISTIIKEEADQFLKDHCVEKGSSQMSSKIGNAHRGNVQLITNVHGMLMNPNVVFYRYEVTINGIVVTKDQIELAKKISQQISNDAQKSDCRRRCRDVITVLKGRKDGYFFDKRCVYFDLQSTLFSLDELEDNTKLTVMNAEMPVRPDHEKFYRYEVHIRKANERFRIQLGDLSGVSKDLALCDHSLAQLLDIATSQYAMFTPSEHVTFSAKLSFLMSPSAYGFCEGDTAIFGDTQSYLGIGATKAVKFMEGPSEGGRSMGVVVQNKKSPFHLEICLLDKAKAFIPLNDLLRFREYERVKLDNFLKGLFVETLHGAKVQRFSVAKVSQDSARSRLISVNGREVTVEEYFEQTYEMALIAPTAPLIECKSRQGLTLYFPMEVCYVCEDQRVRSEQQTPSMTQILIRRCAISPSVLLEQNKKTAKSLHLWDNPELLGADIKVFEEPVEVKADVIPAPTIQFANQPATQVTDKFTWQGDKYVSSGLCDGWAAYAFLDGRDIKYFTMTTFEKFLKLYVDLCKQRGMKITYPKDVAIFESSYNAIDTCFRKASDSGCEFLFAVHGDIDDDAHGAIKYAERNYSLVSQGIRLSTLQNVVEKQQRLTLQNIVNKSNIKFGGLNYSLSLTSKGAMDALNSNTLYIGIASSHPASIFNIQPEAVSRNAGNIFYPAPTVVGFSANIGQNGSFDFVGDFIYQQPYREEKVDVVAVIVERCTNMFKQRRSIFPERVIVYRGGCGEGQFRMVLEYEVPLVKYAFRSMKCESKLTIIAVNKLQEIRFFNKKIDKTRKTDVQNIQPGVVIDHTVVHPVFCEFFLNSHRALQGTARTPKYTVLLDESNMKLGQIESMAYHLCYGHQIVYLPTSVPTPVYVANRYAERGRKLYQQHMARKGTQEADYEALTKELCFFETDTLFGYRVNA